MRPPGRVDRDGCPVAVVTGAGSGIGRATALRLAVDGFRVTLAGRRRPALQETADLIGTPDTLVTVCDVTDAGAVSAMVSATDRVFGRIDVVVNNAGISLTSAFDRVTLTAWREVMAADVESVVLVTQAAMPFLLERGGSVVNVASVAGLGGDAGMTGYNAAKGALVNLTRSLAVEFAARGVRVNAVAPSLTSTDATADIPAEDVAEFLRRIPMGRAADPAEVADVIAFLTSRDARFVTGVVLPVDGGLRAGSGQPPHR
ncbi:SDR family NAD(P)-dependent oxidoreductase [Geodermatophilus sabuli]|uniref:Meso-butanediol dehydrogenase / (S,S)-butanediol dehydrogenase / diacetyl reductase n=1 Tax=Geodermatophilus sabuli TaxID=1564158 RepID=A0A285EDQ7_9ACTN|nr:SDR family NAD(P)-dependent oxidoreductase [Geodermatophilus sabuli]MBB3084557.1 meso-butanediol dehydrogenase/(S,S)-butanediol dehydrogenase/diacetyl reductase [Geodermatophilus sabuli]SNX97248.1 meso-butanediol dehydrogenase / (S,S)-butanediol dehydrogenase / diacetyl reductase [Geodermatophilus sabuli]